MAKTREAVCYRAQKLIQAKCSSLRVIMLTTVCNTRKGKKFENLVLWPSPSTYDLEIQKFIKGYQDMCSWKIASSWVQLFVNYRVTEKQ